MYGAKMIVSPPQLPPRASAVVARVSGEDFDGDFAAEAGIASAVNFAHAACADGRKDFVGTEFCTGSDGHECAGL
jgi:hypothetical protein